MTIKKKFSIPLYFGDLHIIYTDNWEEAFESTKINQQLTENTAAYFCALSAHEFYIFLTDKNPGNIAHESKHFINTLFKYRGVKLSYTNDEAECYMLTWTVNTIHKFLDDRVS